MRDEHLESYEKLPYISRSFEYSHPSSFGAIARLFQFAPKECSSARILELGCAGGTNLLPIAAQYPDAECVGIDFAPVHIEQAKKQASELGLKNITFLCEDFRNELPKLGTFDYIIAHGVFSWIPIDAREAFLKVIVNHLRERGLAYVSYNTLPGWSSKLIARELMNFHTEALPPEQKLTQSRNILHAISNVIPNTSPAYKEVLHRESEVCNTLEDYLLFHDHLEVHNAPVYFHEFASLSHAHGLGYLGDANFGTMLTSDISKTGRELLAQISKIDTGMNAVRLEQYTDFIRNRSFRQSILCHEAAKGSPSFHLSELDGLWIASPLKTEATDLEISLGSSVTFESVSQPMKLNTAEPTIKKLLYRLSTTWPEALPIQSLIAELATEEEKDSLRTSIVEVFSKGALHLLTTPPDTVRSYGEKPKSLAIARMQARHDSRVVNAYHQTTRLNDFNRKVLTLLDGTLAVEQLEGKLAESQALDTTKEGSSHIDQALTRLSNYALLVG